MDRRVRAEDVVVGQDVSEAQFLDSKSVRAHGAGVGADLRLREHDTDAHPSPPEGRLLILPERYPALRPPAPTGSWAPRCRSRNSEGTTTPVGGTALGVPGLPRAAGRPYAG